MIEANNNLLSVSELKTHFAVRKGLLKRTVGYVKAVDGVSFGVRAGKSFGLVGESGCGKTTTARTIAKLIPATSGEIVFDGVDVLKAKSKEVKSLRKEISIIFQDPYGSLNPRMTVRNIIGEPLTIQKGVKGRRLDESVANLLERVGLNAEHINRYPHEFSGGQRQRIGIARALALEPKLVICDEPVSALDVSIQSQILNLLKDLQDEFGLTFMFIAHDLAVVEYFCDVVAVMYLGRIVEQARSEDLYAEPLHPYTRSLMSAIPQVDPELRTQREKGKSSEPPSVTNLPSGCAFHPRCPLADERCKKDTPSLEKKGENEHFVACWKCDSN